MITINNILKKYKDVSVLNNICLNIHQGSIFGFLGPNGAGKTTLIRILTGIIVPDSGQVLINGQSLNKLNVKRIGYLPEERGLYKKMKVGEQAVYLAVLKGLTSRDAERKLKRWFEKLGISDWWDKKVETLSKGMQQKVQFIISAIHRPDVLILDEPFSGLDPVNRETLGNEILELNKAGTTIVLSTHDMNSVEQFCNQVILMNRGNILLSGRVHDIKQAGKSFLYEFCFTRNDELFFSQCHRMDAKIISAEKNENSFCVKVQFQNEQEPEAVLIQTLEQIGLISFREIFPSMHDIFVKTITQKATI